VVNIHRPGNYSGNYYPSGSPLAPPWHPATPSYPAVFCTSRRADVLRDGLAIYFKQFVAGQARRPDDPITRLNAALEGRYAIDLEG